MLSKGLLTDRDMAILKELSDRGLLTSDQLARLSFGQTAKRTALRRLRRLERRHFIARHTGLPLGQLAWSVGLVGAKLLGEEAKTPSVNKNALVHDVLINELRMRLEATGMVHSWNSAYKMHKMATKGLAPGERPPDVIPDGIFGIHTAGGARIVAFEVELSLKTKRRYEENFSLYAEKKGIQLILYVVPTEGFGKRILKDAQAAFESRYGAKPSVVFALVDDVQSSPSKFTLHTLKGTSSFAEIAIAKAKRSATVPTNAAHTAAHRVGTSQDAKKATLAPQVPESHTEALAFTPQEGVPI